MPGALVTFASKLAPSPRLLAFASVVTANFGANGSPEQPTTPNGADTATSEPSMELTVPLIACPAQSVGFTKKPARSRARFMSLMRNGIPRTMVGKGSVVIVRFEGERLKAIEPRMIAVPRSNGPANSGITIDRPNGAPLYGPVR